jgi:hypothetical protein
VGVCGRMCGILTPVFQVVRLVSGGEEQGRRFAEDPTKTALKRVSQGRKLVAGAGFVPRHARIVARFARFPRLFAHTPSLPDLTLSPQFGVRLVSVDLIDSEGQGRGQRLPVNQALDSAIWLLLLAVSN